MSAQQRVMAPLEERMWMASRCSCVWVVGIGRISGRYMSTEGDFGEYWCTGSIVEGLSGYQSEANRM
jgi:hypothetical protein